MAEVRKTQEQLFRRPPWMAEVPETPGAGFWPATIHGGRYGLLQ
jgi:hypothetical protein